jgi:hypothetical protein
MNSIQLFNTKPFISVTFEPIESLSISNLISRNLIL